MEVCNKISQKAVLNLKHVNIKTLSFPQKRFIIQNHRYIIPNVGRIQFVMRLKKQ
jgi:hypothetical protein